MKVFNYYKKMNVKSFFITLAFFGLGVSVAYADDALTLANKIITFNHGGTGALSVSISGKTVTVTGNVTGATDFPVLDIDMGVTVLWKALFESNKSITLQGSGTFEVATGGFLVYKGAGWCIQNFEYCKIKVSGGMVSSTSGAIIAQITKLEISGGTISGNGGGAGSKHLIVASNMTMSGGTVQMTGSGHAIATSGGISDEITITGGMILAKEGYAARNLGGTITISGGIGFAYGTTVADVIYGTFTVLPTNTAVMVAWNKTAGATTYDEGTSTDIYKLPAAATAVWAKQSSEDGILVKHGATEGFIPIAEVTVGTIGISEITNNNLQIFPSPASDMLYFSIETPYEIIDLQGKLLLKSDKAVNSVNISSLPSGIYFVTLHTETGKVIRKVKKE